MLLRARCLELAHLSFTAQVCTMAFGSKGLFTCPVQCENSGPSTFVSVVLHVITNLFRGKKNRSFGPRILKGFRQVQGPLSSPCPVQYPTIRAEGTSDKRQSG
jgi:hypothetical protein